MQLEKTHNRHFGQVVSRYLAFQREYNEIQDTKFVKLREVQMSMFKTLTTQYWYRKVSVQTDSDHLQAFNNFLSLQNLTNQPHANNVIFD